MALRGDVLGLQGYCRACIFSSCKEPGNENKSTGLNVHPCRIRLSVRCSVLSLIPSHLGHLNFTIVSTGRICIVFFWLCWTVHCCLYSLVIMNPIRIFCQMPWDFRVDGHEKKLNPCTMDWAIFVVPTAQRERKVPIVDSLRFPSLGPSLGTIHHPEWRLPATNPMIQVIWNIELNF